MEILRAENLSKIYSSDARYQFALNDVSLHVNEGGFVAIVGPSGGGKSTLLSILGCLDTPNQGRYFVHGEEVNWKSSRQLSRLRGGMLATVFQSFELIPHWTVYENVELGLRLRSMPKYLRTEVVVTMLRKVNMIANSNKYPNELSGGEQQRVAIARALCASPKVLLADEPTGNLDPENAKTIMDLLHVLHQQGTTIVMVTHDMNLAAEADRILTIRGGKLQGEEMTGRLGNA